VTRRLMSRLPGRIAAGIRFAVGMETGPGAERLHKKYRETPAVCDALMGSPVSLAVLL